MVTDNLFLTLGVIIVSAVVLIKIRRYSKEQKEQEAIENQYYNILDAIIEMDDKNPADLIAVSELIEELAPYLTAEELAHIERLMRYKNTLGMRKKDYYFTFAPTHSTIDNIPMGNKWVRVTTHSEEKALSIFVEQFTTKFMRNPYKWAHMYHAHKFTPAAFSGGEYMHITDSSAMPDDI